MTLPKDQVFQIEVMWTPSGTKDVMTIVHKDETFEFNWSAQKVSILNTGDNVWDLVEGKLDQQTINVIGDAIEKYYNKQEL